MLNSVGERTPPFVTSVLNIGLQQLSHKCVYDYCVDSVMYLYIGD